MKGQVTVHSFKEVVNFFLENGVKYVLSERFCQDALENYFGRQRAIGRRRDNPSVRDAAYNAHNFLFDLLLSMFEAQLANLTTLMILHYQNEENNFLRTN